MEQNKRRKIMVLLTDGEDLEKQGVKVAQNLASKGVVVFTIGIGTPAGAGIPIPREPFGLDLLRDTSGQVVQTRLDEATLKAIAEATRGSYHPLGGLGEGLTNVRRAVESPGFSRIYRNAQTRGGSVSTPWLRRCIVSLALESLVGTRRSMRQVTGDRS